jgi:glutamyl-tRNA reductase
MHVSLVGINHQTAPVAIREKMAISNGKLDEALQALRAYTSQGLILSTCNRTEIYSLDEGGCAEEAIFEFLKARLEIPEDILRRYVYLSRDLAAVEHLFRVTSGLDSLIIGEFEVLGQVSKALETAEKAGMVNLPLRYIFNCAIRAGRNVREESGISKNAVSVSSVALDLATKVVKDLTHSKMMVIGAGEAGKLVVKVAKERGASQIVIASRTLERAQAVASALNTVSKDLTTLEEELTGSNIVVTCAAAPHRILDVEIIEKTMQKRPDQPLVIIDIAVPRNVAPEVGKIKNVYLYSIDDLTEISNANRKRREFAIQKAEIVIEAEKVKFASWWQDLEVRPVIGALMEKAEEIRSAQLKKTLKRFSCLSDEQRENLEAMTKSIVTRILQDPINYLKINGNKKQSGIIKELFQLDTENC